MAVRPMKVWNAATSTWDDVAVSQRGDVVNNTDFAAKGDIIAGTGTSAYDNVAVGSNGQMLMADSSATAGLRYVDPPANRNLIINGAMQVAQRGISSTGITATGYYTADRFRMALASLGTWTQTVENDAPAGSGFTKSVKVLCTTADAAPAAGDQAYVLWDLEGQDLQRIKKGSAAAEQLTMSFWVKSNVTGTYIIWLLDLDNTRHVSAAYTINQSATWERKVITFPADTTGAFDNDNARSLLVACWLATGSNQSSGTLATTWAARVDANIAVGQTNLAAATNNYWQITGVQLETGPVATPFEFEPYEATLRKCQRYYYLHASGNNRQVGLGANLTSSDMRVVVHYPVSMRTDPSLVSTTGTDYYGFFRDGSADLMDSLSINIAGKTVANLRNNTDISGTAGHAGNVYTNNAAASIAFSAEL